MASASRSAPLHTVRQRIPTPVVQRLPPSSQIQQRTSIAPFRDQFNVNIPLTAVRVKAKDVGKLRQAQAMREILLSYERIQAVARDPSSAEHRLFLLRYSDPSSIPPAAKEYLLQHGEMTSHELAVDYAYFTADDVLSAVLPETLLDEVPSSFTMIGHIAHLNLREEYLPYRHLIAEVIADKNAQVETVVNKLDGIHNEYRSFDMEVLAGRPDMKVTVVGGCHSLGFDFSKVYFNSRLSTEHSLVVESIPPSSVVIDAFAGVGPFAIPLAKKGCAVIASDLNPASVEALGDAVTRNSVSGRCRVGIGDGREMMRRSVVDLWKDPFPAHFPPPTQGKKKAKTGSPSLTSGAAADPAPRQIDPPRRLATHFIMNLPDTALDFLDAFRGIYSALQSEPGFEGALKAPTGHPEGGMPLVICYCFTRADQGEPAQLDVNTRASAVIGYPISADTVRDYTLHFVRAVAPKKDYYRLVFRLPSQVAFDENLIPLQLNGNA